MQQGLHGRSGNFSSYECRLLTLWLSPARKWLIRKGALSHLVGLPTRIAKQLPLDFPKDVATAIFEGMRTQAKRLQEQPEL